MNTLDCPRCGTQFYSPGLPAGAEVRCARCMLIFPIPERLAGQEERLIADPPPPPRSDRRWYSLDGLEVIVWLDATGAPRAFRLCYGERGAEHATTWSEGKLTHARVDSGEQRSDTGPSYKKTPMLLPDEEFDGAALLALFDAHVHEIPAEFVRFVRGVLSRFEVG